MCILVEIVDFLHIIYKKTQLLPVRQGVPFWDSWDDQPHLSVLGFSGWGCNDELDSGWVAIKLINSVNEKECLHQMSVYTQFLTVDSVVHFTTFTF